MAAKKNNKRKENQMRKMLERYPNLNEEILETINNIINNQSEVGGLKAINEALLNALMKKEREIYLKNKNNSKGNGFYPRRLSTGLGKVDLMIPRDRLSEFRPFLLPEQWQRGDQSYDDLTSSLVIHAYSPNKIKSILHNLGLHYSNEDIDELKEELYQKSIEFKTRELDEKAFVIFIDAYHTKLKDEDSKKVRKAVIYTVIGIDLEGNKEVYGYYEFLGSETKEFWLMVLNDLISRGLKKPVITVSDDFPGLSQAIETLYAKTDHQLCYIHLQRNVKRHMSKKDSKEFNDTLKTLKTLKEFDKAVGMFNSLCKQYQKKYPTFIEAVLEKKELYFTFLKYPQPLRKHIYTTNTAENFNSRLEVMRVNLGGYFQSSKTLNVAIQVLIEKIKKNHWRKPIPVFRECQYEIHQMANQKFSGSQTQAS